MPLMPMPPMPTKWIGPTVWGTMVMGGLLGQGQDGVEQPLDGVGPGELVRRACHGRELGRAAHQASSSRASARR